MWCCWVLSAAADGRVGPEHPGRARCPGPVAFEYLHGRGLASSVRPEQRIHLTARDLKTHPINRAQPAIVLAQPLHLDSRQHGYQPLARCAVRARLPISIPWRQDALAPGPTPPATGLCTPAATRPLSGQAVSGPAWCCAGSAALGPARADGPPFGVPGCHPPPVQGPVGKRRGSQQHHCQQQWGEDGGKHRLARHLGIRQGLAG